MRTLTVATSTLAAAYPSRPTPSFQFDEPPAEQPSTPKSIMTVTLDATPDPTSSSSRARRLRVAAHEVPVGGLREAREVVERFISTHRVGRPSYGPSCGLVRRDGRPICRVDFDMRLWALDPRGVLTGHELDVDGAIVGYEHGPAGGGR